MLKHTLAAVAATSLVFPLSATVAEAASAAEPAGTSLSAGYLVPVQPRLSLATSFVVPGVECSAPDASVSFAVQIASSTAGRYARIGVDADCRDGEVSYGAWYKESGDGRRERLQGRIKPGDVMSMDMTGTRSTVYADISNDTRGWGNGLAAVRGLVPDTGSVVASERPAPAGIRPLADFGTVTFTHTELDSKPIKGPVTRVAIRSGGVLKATATQLIRKTGTFSVDWLHG